MDIAHAETDEILRKLERRIASVYGRALDELQEKLDKYLGQFAEQDKEMFRRQHDGEITYAEYKAWRRDTMMQDKFYSDLIEKLSDDLVNADEIAMQIVSDSNKDVFAKNANYATYDIEHQTQLNTSFNLLDKNTVEILLRDEPDLLPQPEVDIPADLAWNRKHITNEITQGILQGEPIPDIAARLERVVGMDYNAAIRNARTATTGAQNSGRVASYKRAEAMGIDLQQEWLATLDKRTRHEHRILDGQRVAVGKKFSVNGDTIEYPGDPNAKGYLIYNCRCTLVPAIKGYDQSDAPRYSKLGDMTYDEWKTELQKKVKNTNDASNNNDNFESRINNPDILKIYKDAEKRANWILTEDAEEYVWGTNDIRIKSTSRAADKIHELGHYLDKTGKYTMHEHREANELRPARDYFTEVSSISDFLKIVRMNEGWYASERDNVLAWCCGQTDTNDPLIGFAVTLIKLKGNGIDLIDLDCFSDIISAMTDAKATGALLTGHEESYWKQYDTDFNAFPVREAECFTNYCALRNHEASVLISQLTKLAPNHVMYWERAYQVMIGRMQYLEV